MPISAVDAITPAFQHMKKQLIQPFRFGQWVRLAVVGFLAGELSSGGGCNSGGFNFPTPQQHPRGSEQFLGFGPSWPPELVNHPAMLAGLIAFLIVAGLVFIVLFTYISSVMRFILFDSIVAKECHIRDGWVRRQSEGFRLFVWQILLMLATFAVLIILVGLPLAIAWSAGWFKQPSAHILPLVLGGILLFFLFMALILIMAVVHVMTKDFVVPQMALEGISAMEGWRRLWPRVSGEKGGYAGYIGMKIVMAIGAGIVFGIITVIVMLVLLIPIGGVGVVAVLGGKAAGMTWNLYTITLAVVVGCVALAILIFAISLISVPVAVFFPAYSIYFFAARYPKLAALLWPPPPAQPVAVAPPRPPEPPPLPPTPVLIG